MNGFDKWAFIGWYAALAFVLGVGCNSEWSDRSALSSAGSGGAIDTGSNGIGGGGSGGTGTAGNPTKGVAATGGVGAGTAGSRVGAGNGGGTSGGGAGGSTTAGRSVTGTGGQAAGGLDAGSGAGVGGTQPNTCGSIREFNDWPAGKAPKEIGDLLVKDYLSRARGQYHYADACAWYGALAFTKLTNDTKSNDALVSNFGQFLNGNSYYPVNGTTVDDRVGGIVPLEIFIETKDKSKNYLSIGLKPADDQYTQYSGNLNAARHWIDDMFMITALQVQATRATGEAKYLIYAAKQMVSYFDQQQSDGLFFHTRTSKVRWGRGNGWFAVGMTMMLLDLPAGSDRDTIMQHYTKMMTALKDVQIPQGNDGAGLWRQVLNVDTAWYESSCSAMFTFAIATGVKNGWLDAATFAPVARNGWSGVTAQINAAGKLSNICEGTGSPAANLSEQQQIDYYLARAKSSGDLHGQAAVMWSATTFLRDYPCSQ